MVHLMEIVTLDLGVHQYHERILSVINNSLDKLFIMNNTPF